MATSKSKLMDKLSHDLIDMTREEIRAYSKAIVNGSSENSSGITFIYRGLEVWAGNFGDDGRSTSTNVKNLKIM